MQKKCKYCGSEMELTEEDVNQQFYICMNENCKAQLEITEDTYEIKEEWNTDYED